MVGQDDAGNLLENTEAAGKPREREDCDGTHSEQELQCLPLHIG